MAHRTVADCRVGTTSGRLPRSRWSPLGSWPPCSLPMRPRVTRPTTRRKTSKPRRSTSPRPSKLAIQHDDDLIVDAGGLLADPTLSQTGFERWSTAARISERYPEAYGHCRPGLSTTPTCPRSQNGGGRSTAPLAADGTFEAASAGTRPFDRLVKAGVVIRKMPDVKPSGTTTAPTLWSSGSYYGSGHWSRHLRPISRRRKTWLGILTPIYDGGVIPQPKLVVRSPSPAWSSPRWTPRSCWTGGCGTTRA